MQACKDAQGYSPRPKGMLMGSGGPIQSYTITTKSYPKPSNPHEERNTSKDSTSNCCVISLHQLVPPATMRITPSCDIRGYTCCREEKINGKRSRGDGKLDGPILVYSIIRFSCVKSSLLNMTEDWTVQEVITKT